MKSGQVLDDRYELVQSIGGGGMGSVWEARNLSDGRRVAVKVLHKHLVDEKDLVARFLREGQAAMEARYSGHIIEVLDVVHHRGTPPFLVMEFLEGENLSEILRREGPFAVTRAVDLVIQSCHAVAEVHRQDIIHRDIKPDNLFVIRLNNGSDWIKLLDFGVAKFSGVADQLSRPLTAIGSAVGTPHYMAPEQILAMRELDHRLDVYSMGVVLYELLTGKRPYETSSLAELVMVIARGDPPRPRELRPEIERGLERAVLRAMALDRKNRFESMYDMAEALEPYTHGQDSRAEPLVQVSTVRTKVERSEVPQETQPTFSFREAGAIVPHLPLFESAAARPQGVAELPRLYSEDDAHEYDETRVALQRGATPARRVERESDARAARLPRLYDEVDDDETFVAPPRNEAASHDPGALRAHESRGQPGPGANGALLLERATSDGLVHARSVSVSSLPRLYSAEEDDATQLSPAHARTPTRPMPATDLEEASRPAPGRAGTVVISQQYQDEVRRDVLPLTSGPPGRDMIPSLAPSEADPAPSFRERTGTALRRLRRSRAALYLLVGLAVTMVVISLVLTVLTLFGSPSGHAAPDDEDWVIEE